MTLSITPPPGSVVVCLAEMRPESAKRFQGQEWVPVQEPAPLALLEPPTVPAERRAGPAPTPSLPPQAPARAGGLSRRLTTDAAARGTSVGPSSRPMARR
jgi:hypothetical protein